MLKASLELMSGLFGRFRSPVWSWTVVERVNMSLPQFRLKIG